MKFRYPLFFLGMMASLSPLRAESTADTSFFFRDGDQAMILGDSITEQRQYSTLLESFVLSRFPNWKISFRNTGWSGDTMGLSTRGGIEKGFERDLAPLQPTVATITFGMNDARRGDAAYDDYLANARKLTAKFAAMGTRVALISPSSEEQFQKDYPAGSPYNAMLCKYSEGLAGVAKEQSLPFVNQISPMISVIEAGRTSGVLPTTGGGLRVVPDGVHPNWGGHFIMATAILKGLNAPSLVSTVTIDATNGNTRTENATVTEVKTGDMISFTRLDEALPWPIPADALFVTRIPGFSPFDELSRYELKVTGLPAPHYNVAVDGASLGVYSANQLSAGVNLSEAALSAMPVLDQLHQAILAKNQLFHQLWRAVKVAVVPQWIPSDVVEQYRDEKINEVESMLAEAEVKLDALRIPKATQWTLTPVLENQVK